MATNTANHKIRYKNPATGNRPNTIEKHSMAQVLQFLRFMESIGRGDAMVTVSLDTRFGDTLYQQDEIVLDGPAKLVRERLEDPWNGF